MLTESEKIALKQKIRANSHEVFLVSIDQMDAIVESAPTNKSKQIKDSWQKLRGKMEFGASYTATASDILVLTKLVADLGSVGAQAYVKTYGGKAHIILKGAPGLRKVLTGTKYGVTNPKVIAMGLGKTGAIHAAKSGGLLTVVLLTAFRVADYFLQDEATLSRLIGSIGTDVAKVGIATGASILAVKGVAAAGFTIAIGPIFAVIAVGVIASVALNALDSHYGITDRVVAGLDEMGDDILDFVERKKKQALQAGSEAAESVVDYVLESAEKAMIDLSNHLIDRFFSNRPWL